MELEDKRTLAWAIYMLANYDIPKEEFEKRALVCINETLEKVKNNVVLPDVRSMLPNTEEVMMQCSKILIAKNASSTAINGFQEGFDACIDWLRER